MYLKKPGHTPHIIKDLYTVYLPPVPDKELIQGWELKKGDQFWRRAELPSFYEERREEEEYKQKEEQKLVDAGELKQITHFDTVLERYRKEEWRKRITGHWFMNNGKPVYITGAHYYYLQWCKLDVGYPTFYMSQVDRFYFRQLCWEDPFCLGYFIVGPRGFGKSVEEASAVLESITRPPHSSHAGIQSKNKEDAEVFFTQKMVPMFNGLPHFFKPQFNHGTNPVKGFNMSRERDKGKGSKNTKFGEQYELSNTVLHFPAKEKAMDNRTFTNAVQDELGKLNPREEADAVKRIDVVIRCVWRNDRKYGIIRGTSTIEEMKEGGAEAKILWDGSNPLKRDANGFTKSKLYKYLVSGLETKVKYADKHGYIDQNKALIDIINDRDAVRDDPAALASRMRKEPLQENDAFLKEQDDCTFPVLILNKRLNQLDLLPPQGRKGRLEYLTGKVDSEVFFKDDPEGNFTIYHMPDEFRGKRKILNHERFEYDGDKKLYLPCNDDLFTGGLDPINWVKTKDKRASKMAAYGIIRYDPILDGGRSPLEWITHNLLWKYHGRHLNPEDDYEEIIKALRFFGHRINAEGNISVFDKHLYDRGYHRFKIFRRDFDVKTLAGKTKNELSVDNSVNTTSEVINTYVSHILKYLFIHGHRCPDKELIKQLMDFDPTDTKIFDLVVAFGYALLALDHKINYDYIPQPETMVQEIETYFPTYDNSGNYSRPLEKEEEDPDDFDEDLYASIRKAVGF